MRSEVKCIFLEMAASAAATFSFRLGGRRSRWSIDVEVPPKEFLSSGPVPISLPYLL